MKKLFLLLLALFPVLLSAQEQFSVYFDSNKADLKKSEQDRLINWAIANRDSKVLAINGYTDEDGSIGLNDTLSQRRVSYVFDMLKGKVPARSDFKTRSFGKLHKQSPVKAENRKVTIYYLKQQDLHLENQVLGITDAPKPAAKPVKYPEKIVIRNPRGGSEEIKLDVEFMKKVGEAKPGDKLTLKNLNFYENTYGIVTESRPKLFELLEIMKLHPGLKIKLLGHICCMNGDPRKLSYQRAKAIMMFLNQNGIEKSRLSFEGLGTTQPIYNIPEKNEEERAANRRVEVLVMENN
jgi:outer membrane protein OmpA-like peptidoglycan-associated protein